MRIDRLRDLRKERHLTQEMMAAKFDIPRTTYAAYEQGNREPDDEMKLKMAQYFNVTVDYLLGNSTYPTRENNNHYYDLTDKDRRDIGTEVDRVLNGLDSKDEVNFYGEPMSDEDKEKMRMAMQTALEIAKREAKKKFTPKKYRDDTDA